MIDFLYGFSLMNTSTRKIDPQGYGHIQVELVSVIVRFLVFWCTSLNGDDKDSEDGVQKV